MRTRKPEGAGGDVPIACALSSAELETRSDKIRRLAAASLEKTDLEDGIALRFPDSAQSLSRLVRFIRVERLCCPFFTFELAFEPDLGPIWLRVRGPEGAKAFLESVLTEDGGEASMKRKLYSETRRAAGALVLGGLTLLAGLASARPAPALEVRAGVEVAVGSNEVVDDDLYLFGETVTIDGVVTGDVMASGINVILRGEVTGDLTGCARTFVIDGKVGDDVRVAGMVLRLGSESRVGDDVMSAGLSFESAAGSSVEGSVGFLGYQARVAGDVAEDLGAAAVGVELLGAVAGDVEVEVESEASPLPLAQWMPALEPLPEIAPGLALAGSARVGGDLTYTSLGEGRIAPEARIEGSVLREEPQKQRLVPYGAVVIAALSLLLGLGALWLVARSAGTREAPI